MKRPARVDPESALSFLDLDLFFFFFSPPCDSGGTTGFSVYDTRCHVVFSDSKAKLRVVSDVRKARMPFFFCFPWELSLRDEKSARKTWTSDGMT